MIVINTSSAQNIPSIRSKRITNKKSANSVFQDNIPPEHESLELSGMTPITNPLLFLQEMDEYKEDQTKLKESGNKILRCLNDIRLALLNEKLQENHVIYLKHAIEKNKWQLKFPELQSVIDDIILRAEVELAKIEMNFKSRK